MFDVEHDCYVMGILNVTPDSFSDGGKWNDLEKARQHTKDMIAEGAAIIDVGGESTRPGHVQITIKEEIQRVVPVIEMIKKEFDIPVSIDSYKSQVVEAALQAGADLVNDIWGLKYDRKVADLIAKYQVPCCLMHNRDKAEYDNFLDDMCADMRESLAIAKEAGIKDDPYELSEGMPRTKELVGSVKPGQEIGVFIGPEGGFEEAEVELARSAGFEAVTLGKRILRTETAGLTVMAWLMYQLEE